MSITKGDISATEGARMGAIIVASILYGTNLMLFCRYFRSPLQLTDAQLVKGTVALLCLLTTMQIVSLSHGMYCIVTIRPPPPVIFSMTSLIGIALSTYLLAFFAQLFFASRTWILSRGNWFLVAPILLFTAVQLVAGIVQVGIIIGRGDRTPDVDLFHNSMIHTTIQGIATAVADVFITFSLYRVLNGSRSGIKKTDNVIDKLVKYAIHRGVMTSLAAAANVVLFDSLPNTPAFLIPLLASGQLSATSMVSMLLNRSSLQDMLQDGELDDLSLPALDISPHGSRSDAP